MDGDGGFGALDSGQQEQQGGNPAWNDVLSVIPQELHSQVTPHFQKWDKGVQDMVGKVHQEYEPWKPIIKNGDPETVQFAVQLLGALESDPKSVYTAIQQHYKDQLGDLIQPTPGQGQGEPNKDLEDKPWLADIAQVKQENEMLAKLYTQQQQMQMNAAADAQLDTELAKAKKDHGEFDEQFVLGLMANKKMTTDQAVTAWKQSVQSYAEKMGFAGPKPMFLGGGSNIPGSNVDLKKTSDKETKDVVIQMLAAAAQQNK